MSHNIGLTSLDDIDLNALKVCPVKIIEILFNSVTIISLRFSREVALYSIVEKSIQTNTVYRNCYTARNL